ncbi:interleukin-3 receptor subunit alpha [Gracilinanus agilis]|uniref:interleukin-3 receptor subunit alpha n=1 Tax=Gracilinanus agilis TaxID=191870 RepID=UPI001CFEF265|nr:interleukin-3 receptor subunit alpha [Gracilinanus agilis]
MVASTNKTTGQQFFTVSPILNLSTEAAMKAKGHTALDAFPCRWGENADQLWLGANEIASGSPIENITIDLKKMELRWTNVENVEIIDCSVKVLSKKKYTTPAKENKTCELSGFHSWCHGAEFQINGFAGKSFSKIFHLPQRGKEGNTEEKVTCQVYEAKFMNCNWTVRKIPRDINYRFFYSSEEGKFVDKECPWYKKDSKGRNVGCHFDDISGFEYSKLYHVLVNGTSNGTEVQCNDDYIILNDIEIIEPPNININCRNFSCYMHWSLPKSTQLFKREFEYQLDIRKDNETSYNLKIENVRNYVFKNVVGKHTVKIRAKKRFSGNWSEWSKPHEFGQEDPEGNPLTFILLSLLGVAFIMFFIMGYLCKRYHMIHKIFPPVPHVRDQLSDNFQKYVQVVWEENKMLPEQCKIEEIQVIEKKANYPKS